jgi:hypothetical protein
VLVSLKKISQNKENPLDPVIFKNQLVFMKVLLKNWQLEVLQVISKPGFVFFCEDHGYES